MRAGLLILLSVATALLGPACASLDQIHRRQAQLEARLNATRARAYVCAPRELAEAEVSMIAADHFAKLGEGKAALDQLGRAGRILERAESLSVLKICGGDRDDDGIPDDQDACPDVAENFNGDQDHDGCPEVAVELAAPPPLPPAPAPPPPAPLVPADRDGDGLLDTVDQCPDEAGGASSGGCPYRHIVVENDRIVLRHKIYFRRGKAKLDPASRPLLDEVAAALRDRSKLRVRIEGHTDSKGSARTNQWLSYQRALAVKEYLVERRISTGRLSAVGMGEENPIADNETEDGRETNRRVEFHIEGGH